MKKLLSALLCLLGVFGGPSALAHSTSTSFLIIDVAAEPVTLRWDLSLADIAWTVFIDADYDGNVTWQEVLNARPALGAAVLGQISLQRGGVPCALTVNDFALASRSEQNFLSVAMRANVRNAGWPPLGAHSS